MLKLELTKANATLENLNPRMEKHGPDKVPAATLKFSTATGADVLAFFSPTLRAFLFDTEGPKDLADGVRVRDPHLGYPLTLDHEMSGAHITIDYGVGDNAIVFDECQVDDFRITPMDGGSVILTFRVHCVPDEKQIGRLYLLQEQAVTITLDPAELPEAGKIAA